MKTMEIRATKLHVRSDEQNTHQIEGTAIVYNEPSQDMGFVEYIMPGALEGVDLSQLLLLYSHDYQNVLASIPSGSLAITDDDNGLHFTAELPNTTLGNDVAELIATNRVSGMSFGFKIADGGDIWSQGGDGTTIHTVTQIQSMSEISITPIPAYQETQVSTQVQRSLEKFKKGVEKRDMNKDETLVDLLKETLQKLQQSKPADDQPVDSDTKPNPADSNDQPQKPTPAPTRDDGDDEDRAAKTSAAQKASANAGDTVTPQPTLPGTKKRDDGDDEQTNAKKTDEAVPQAEQANEGAASSSTAPTDQKQPVKEKKRDIKEGGQNMAQDITPQLKVVDEEKRDFEEFLRKGEVKRAADSHIALSDGSVIIPETILNPEHEQHQFPRLGGLVRKIAVKTTTGKLPVFMTSDDTLSEHTEFGSSSRHAVPEIKPIPWDLKSYSSTYAYSQELLDDSQYNWETELQARLLELRDNTDDAMIMAALTTGITVSDGSADIVAAIKDALDKRLKPQDSQAATIVLSQSAFATIHKLQDKEGRDLIQPDMTQGASVRLLGKTVVVVADELFPNAKAGDINVVIAPMQKAVIEFKNHEITGKFIDTYDVFYRLLGIYERLDVVQARPDLIALIAGTAPKV